MSRKKRAASGALRKRRFLEREASIDAKLDAAIRAIDWHRRRLATASAVNFMRAYCMERGSAILVEPPDGALVKIVHEMQRGIGDASIPYHIRMPRGEGKTAYMKGTAAWAAATGRRHHIVTFAAARPDAVQIVEDIFSVFLHSDAFCRDFPEIALPIRLVGGSFKRRQFYNKHLTEMVRRTGKLVLPTIIAKKAVPQIGIRRGEPWPASGAIFDARGFLGHARGAAQGASRPDLLLLDDLQDEDDAANPDTVKKNAERIRRGILNMGGRRKVATIMTSTPIEPDDLSEEFAKDTSWRTRTVRAFRSFPTDWAERGMDGLWGSYVRLYRRALAQGAKNPLKEATEFYRTNREAMDAGASVLSPRRFDPKVQISGIQAKMDRLFEIGPAAFDAEFQMHPRRAQFAYVLTAHTILERIRHGLAACAAPTGHDFIAAATDINPSYALTTAVVAFDRDRTAVVLWHGIDPIHFDDTVNDTAFTQGIYSALADHGRKLAALGMKVNAWGIDAGGKQFDAVTAFAPNAKELCGLPACAMTGRASHMFNPRVSSRLRDAINDTVLCGERSRGSAGRRWIAWSADTYREQMQRSWATETGAPGGLSLFDAGVDHTEFAEQVARETLRAKRKLPDGRFQFKWKTADPHDFGDCLAMCYAIAGSEGISGGTSLPPVKARRKRKNRITVR